MDSGRLRLPAGFPALRSRPARGHRVPHGSAGDHRSTMHRQRIGHAAGGALDQVVGDGRHPRTDALGAVSPRRAPRRRQVLVRLSDGDLAAVKAGAAPECLAVEAWMRELAVRAADGAGWDLAVSRREVVAQLGSGPGRRRRHPRCRRRGGRPRPGHGRVARSRHADRGRRPEVAAVITKVVHGWRPGGLIAYLMGSGARRGAPVAAGDRELARTRRRMATDPDWYGSLGSGARAARGGPARARGRGRAARSPRRQRQARVRVALLGPAGRR